MASTWADTSLSVQGDEGCKMVGHPDTKAFGSREGLSTSEIMLLQPLGTTFAARFLAFF